MEVSKDEPQASGTINRKNLTDFQMRNQLRRRMPQPRKQLKRNKWKDKWEGRKDNPHMSGSIFPFLFTCSLTSQWCLLLCYPPSSFFSRFSFFLICFFVSSFYVVFLLLYFSPLTVFVWGLWRCVLAFSWVVENLCKYTKDILTSILLWSSCHISSIVLQ